MDTGRRLIMERFIALLVSSTLGLTIPAMATEFITPGLKPLEIDPRTLSLYQPFYREGRTPSCASSGDKSMSCLSGVAAIDDVSVISPRTKTNFARLSRQCMEGSSSHVGEYIAGPYLINIERGGLMLIRTWLRENNYPKVHLDGICWLR
jgi:hypothetical protein